MPLAPGEAAAMIREIRGWALLEGFRGGAVADVDALTAAIEGLAVLAEDLGTRLDELDVNPLFVLPKGAGVRVADALVVLGS